MNLITPFRKKATYSPTGGHDGGSGITALVGQASCLSIQVMTGNPAVAGLSHHFHPNMLPIYGMEKVRRGVIPVVYLGDLFNECRLRDLAVAFPSLKLRI
jgi:hypothetical protein